MIKYWCWTWCKFSVAWLAAIKCLVLVAECLTTMCMSVGNRAAAATDRSAFHAKPRMLQQRKHAQRGTMGAQRTTLPTKQQVHCWESKYQFTLWLGLWIALWWSMVRQKKLFEKLQNLSDCWTIGRIKCITNPLDIFEPPKANLKS